MSPCYDIDTLQLLGGLMSDIPISYTSIDNGYMILRDLLKVTQIDRILFVGNDVMKRASLLWSIVGQVV